MSITTPGSNDQRTYVSGRFELEIDGFQCGILSGIDGGHFKSEAIGEQVGGEGLVTRYPGRQKFEEITLTIGTSMSDKFWSWVKSFIDNKPRRYNGAIVARDFNNRERSRRTFYDAIISEVQFPQLDLKSKSPKNITVKIAPERIEYTNKTEQAPTVGPGAVKRQKAQTPQNFAFAMEGIDAAFTRRVVKLDAFSVKQNVIAAPVGGLLYAPNAIGRLEFPTLSIYVPETYLGPWMQWWELFVGRGEHVGKNERTGGIKYLSSNFSEDFLNLDLFGVGITGITFDKHEGHGETIRTAKVDLYVESMTFKAKPLQNHP